MRMLDYTISNAIFSAKILWQGWELLKQRGKETCPRSHSKLMALLGLNSWLPAFTSMLIHLHRPSPFTLQTLLPGYGAEEAEDTWD